MRYVISHGKRIAVETSRNPRGPEFKISPPSSQRKHVTPHWLPVVMV